MIIKSIKIENFKSIKNIEFDVKKYGDSYTTMLLGINESGKSNVLQAMSFLDTPKEEFDYNIIHNQKDEEYNYIDLWYYLDFETKNTYLNIIKDKIENGNLLDFTIANIVKNIYLEKDSKVFSEEYNYDIKNLTKGLYIKKTTKIENINGQQKNIDIFKIFKNNDEESCEELTDDLFKKYFDNDIKKIIKKYEPKVSFWKPSDKYLISEVDLESFKKDTNSNIPLKNIFALSGYKTNEQIEIEINLISNHQLRKRLMRKLSKNTTDYIKKIWKHKINIDIEITDTNKCIIYIKDDGKKNEDNYHQMSVRSEGFKQFISLILSLSIETKKLGKKNRLILIDEPESHLHPSGIRDLSNELLEIGKTNYLFISTHSPFLVDKNNKERNIIIKKNNLALTEKKVINSYDDIRDDEVLDEAFGINIYKDLLNSHRLLVEGASDKIILSKALELNGKDYSITNGTGSNIVQIASKLNYDDISIIVLVDDDKDGDKYKKNILQIGGLYNSDNVFTIRDLVGKIKNEGTIEDTLGKVFIESLFKKNYKKNFSKESTLILIDDKPFINQIKIFLQKNGEYSDEFIFNLKKEISESFKPTRAKFNTNFPLLKSLIDRINEKLS